MTSKDRHEVRYQRRKQKRQEKLRINIGQYDNFDNIRDANNLINAYYKSKKGVDWKESIQRYERNLLKNVSKTQKELDNGKKITKGFIVFYINERGKTRRIRSVRIKERVIRRSYCDNVLNPTFMYNLFYYNKASMPGGGVHFHLDAMEKHLHQFYRSNNFSNKGYVLQIDFSKYFDNISHKHLHKEIRKRFSDTRVVALSEQLIKSFEENGEKKSLGIGSQDSQIFGVSYPNKIDHYIKEKLEIKFYGRYMDDSYLIHKDKEYLKYCLEEIRKLCKELGIVINEKKTQIVKLSSWFIFLKWRYKLTESGKVIKKPCPKSIIRERRKLKSLKRKLDNHEVTYKDIECQYSSWRGYITYGNSYRTVKNMDNFYNKLFVKEIEMYERNNPK